MNDQVAIYTDSADNFPGRSRHSIFITLVVIKLLLYYLILNSFKYPK